MASDENLEFLCALKSNLVWCVNKGVVLLLELRYWIRFHLTMGIYALRKQEFFKKHALCDRETVESHLPSQSAPTILVLKNRVGLVEFCYSVTKIGDMICDVTCHFC